ncbi:Translation machinery-associated protein 46 [Rhodotorula kratochvilovae]
MPPKKQDNKPKKVAVDKTFGMKNKNKSTKVQQQVKIIQQQEAQKGINKEVLNKQKEKERINEKKKAEQAKRELEGELYGGVELIVQPKVPFGVDPKTVLCAFHKVGKCTKGSKCKFSHDLNADRKGAKASMYADQRDEKKQDAEGTTMADWTEEQLREVLSKKGNPKATTDIVCKHFLEAIEEQKYGYFWLCPNGESCMYRHALPPGFVLKSQRKKEDDDAKNREISLEDFLEVERHKLDQSKLTPLTKESFAEWKKTRVSKKEAEEQALQSAKSATAAAGKLSGLSGRDLFTFNPEMLGADDDDDEGEDDWDLEALRVKTEKEREEKELERIRQLDASYGKLSVTDDGGAEPPAA